jgi:hypothetical protein
MRALAVQGAGDIACIDGVCLCDQVFDWSGIQTAEDVAKAVCG